MINAIRTLNFDVYSTNGNEFLDSLCKSHSYVVDPRDNPDAVYEGAMALIQSRDVKFDEYDVFHKHVHVMRLYKNCYVEHDDIEFIADKNYPCGLEKLTNMMNVDDSPSETLNSIISNYLELAFNDGESYGFNDDDGLIIQRIHIEEYENYTEIFGYYAYYGK